MFSTTNIQTYIKQDTFTGEAKVFKISQLVEAQKHFAFQVNSSLFKDV